VSNARVSRVFFVVSGSLSLGIGIAGVFLPLLPTAPFLLLSAACYARGSKRLHRWLLENRLFGRTVRNYVERRGVSRGAKLLLLALLWGSIAFSALFAVRHAALRAALFAVAALVSLHILRLKTVPHDPRAKEGPHAG
jgi:uncharacterized membrane protein YbaN (DUF454 family)